jgi:Fic family protein
MNTTGKMTNSLEQLIAQYTAKTQGVINYEKHTLYVSTFHSTAIEGSTLTEGQVIDLLSYGKTASGKPFQEHLMVKDHYEALLFTMQLAKKKTPLSLSLIQQIGAKVMQNTGSLVNTILGSYDITKGEFRKGGVFAGQRHFPNAKKVPDLMRNLLINLEKDIENASTIEEQLRLSFRLHFDFVSIHPFGDGNGRVSRLLMNYIQAYFELPISIVFKSSRLSYINALERTRKAENIELFYKFMFTQYTKFLNKELKQFA